MNHSGYRRRERKKLDKGSLYFESVNAAPKGPRQNPHGTVSHSQQGRFQRMRTVTGEKGRPLGDGYLIHCSTELGELRFRCPHASRQEFQHAPEKCQTERRSVWIVPRQPESVDLHRNATAESRQLVKMRFRHAFQKRGLLQTRSV
jgi:hypothetical protein